MFISGYLVPQGTPPEIEVPRQKIGVPFFGTLTKKQMGHAGHNAHIFCLDILIAIFSYKRVVTDLHRTIHMVAS